MVENDGSTDATGHLAGESRRGDSRVRLSDLGRIAGRATEGDRGWCGSLSPLPGDFGADDSALAGRQARAGGLPREVDVGVPGSVACFASSAKRSLPTFGELQT